MTPSVPFAERRKISMNVVILSGGVNTERNVSLNESTYIADNLRGFGHNVAIIDMYMGIEDYPGISVENIFEQDIPEKWRFISPAPPDLDEIKRVRHLKSKSVLGDKVLDILLLADVVFLCFGGAYGEDGKVQGLLEVLGIPYTGSSTTGCAIAMNKTITKELLSYHGIRTPGWKSFCGKDDCQTHLSAVKLPCVVKTPTGGSSIGTYICYTKKELETAITNCLEFDKNVLIEDYVEGREFSCGILNDYPLPPIEILTTNHNYTSKYCEDTADECPANISHELEAEIQDIALRVHKALRLNGYSRSDFMLSNDGKLYFLECNVIPGMTPKSLLPKEARAIGIDYGRLCNIILNTALQRG